MQNKKSFAAFISIFCTLLFALSLISVYKTGAISELNPQADAAKETMECQSKKDSTIEGIFLDRSGEKITDYSAPGEAAICLYPESFSPIIGYNSARLGESGLRKTLFTELFDGGRDDVGATVQLTLQSSLQNKLYRLLQGVGSISIIKGSTGEILGMVSKGDEELSYNVNLIDEKVGDSERYYSDLYNEIEDFYYNRATFAQDPPGSTAKVLTTVALCDAGLDSFEITDNGLALGYIKNNNNGAYGNCDLSKALAYSVNTYFAQAGEMLGAKLQSTFEAFSIGTPIETDFTTLHSNFSNSTPTEKLFAENAFGQGELVITPLHLASVAATIMNNGAQYRPYLIKEITNDEKRVYKEKPEILNQVASEETIDLAKSYLRGNAKVYGFYPRFSEEIDIFCKTGTAQVAGGKKNHIYLMIGVELNGESYGICIDRADTSASSSSLKKIGMEVLDLLIEETEAQSNG